MAVSGDILGSEGTEHVCHPSGIRVWQGWRTERYRNRIKEFQQKLGSIFMPVTIQLMEPLGLAAYLPAIPTAHDNVVPDEIALVAYPSQAAYERADREVAVGRAYGALHSTVFNFDSQSDIPCSRSAFPVAWNGDYQVNTPYYLLERSANWRSGTTRLYMARRREAWDESEFRDRLVTAVADWLPRRPESIDGGILVVEKDYLIYWEHHKGQSEHPGLIPALADILGEPLMHRSCEPVQVEPIFAAGEGLPISGGEFFNLRSGCSDIT